jgi:membrane protein implicated in regulation of membrane protease activity
MDSRHLGTMLVIVGGLIMVIGLLIATGSLNWFGRLPGDIRIERDNVNLYLPITTMLLLSVGLSLVLWLVRKFL